MLKKRVVFTLLYHSGSFMLSRNFRLQKVGDLKWLKHNYNFSKIAFSIDELIVLDVTRGERDEEQFLFHVKALSEECFIPISAGGGIRSVEQARRLLHSGADKIVLNTVMAFAPEVVGNIASEFGRQCVIAAVDIKKVDSEFVVYIENGMGKIDYSARNWLAKIADSSVGEIYLNSIDRDGTGQGYHLEMLDLLPEPLVIPVIMAGGAGKSEHLAAGLQNNKVNAVATAHLFNFVGDGLEQARNELLSKGLHLAVWDVEMMKLLSKCIK